MAVAWKVATCNPFGVFTTSSTNLLTPSITLSRVVAFRTNFPDTTAQAPNTRTFKFSILIGSYFLAPCDGKQVLDRRDAVESPEKKGRSVDCPPSGPRPPWREVIPSLVRSGIRWIGFLISVAYLTMRKVWGHLHWSSNAALPTALRRVYCRSA